jgi:hypothetical protein
MQVGKAIKRKTWKSTALGTPCVIAGVIGVTTGLVFSVFSGFVGVGGLSIGAPSITVGIIAIVGGIYALKRQKTWRPTAAGILCIIGGIGGVFFGIVATLLLFLSIFGVPDTPGREPPTELPGLLNESLIFLLIWAILGIIAIVMAVVGGVYAVRRRIWRLALAGSICTLIGPWGLLGILIPSTIPLMLPFTIPGIFATIFIVKGKGEFS